jgi:hypothetical protein
MENAKKERRISDRKQMVGLLPGKITILPEGKLFNCKPVDVSFHGLGVVADSELDINTRLSLDLTESTVELKIAWIRPDFNKHDLYRYGLTAIDPNINLEAIFEKTGCLV